MVASKGNYDKYPVKKVSEDSSVIWSGWKNLSIQLKKESEGKEKCVIVIDCYPGTDTEAVRREITERLRPNYVFFSDDCLWETEKMDAYLEEWLTDDRVFGIMTAKSMRDFFYSEKLEQVREEIASGGDGIYLVYGVGAGLITEGDVLVYADMSRWEIQLRYRSGMPNWNCRNNDAPILTKYKRGFFAEWRWADRHKKQMFERIDYILDTNHECPVMVTGDAFREGLRKLAGEPFRTVPYFDPGVWGGQWMKKICGLPEEQPNYAWSFDGVPEENSLLLQYGDTVIEIPAMDLVMYQPQRLLGERVHGRFGAEFPIRFDFLDTMGGQNLSLQVHPLTEYIQEKFHMHYTQDESYYILDGEEDACVYLGVKTGVDKKKMLDDLESAERGEMIFPAEDYVNCFPVKKHDHVLIPAGTIHCSGANTMVLEVSATPYIFTFKLWDWARVGLDGKPRPIHLEHGKNNIQWNRDTEWVKENLLHQDCVKYEDENCKIVRTGLHEREFLDTYRCSFWGKMRLLSDGGVHMLNLVEGSQAVITSADNKFEPFIVHYAETFIIPAAAGECVIEPIGDGVDEEHIVLLATVRP